MSDQEKQEGQKTVVSFVSGLLIGGLLVWAFSGSPKEDKKVESGDNAPTAGEVTDTTADQNTATGDQAIDAGSTMVVGDGSLTVMDQPAGTSIALESATFPTDEGWVAVRSYVDNEPGSILGAARYSKEQGLVPTSVDLLVPTLPGREYAVVFFSEDGNRDFNLDGDVQIESGMTTFTAK